MRVPCRHEHVLRPFARVVDVLRWWRDGEHGESSWMAWTLLPLLPSAVPVVHVVRDPWKVVDSLTNRNVICKTEREGSQTMQSIRDTIRTYLPDALDWDAWVDRAAAFVVGWNELIAKRLPDRCVVYAERFDVPMVQRALRHIGAERTDQEVKAALESVRTNINAGYTVVETQGISDPLIAEWIRQYAEERGCSRVYTRRIRNTPLRQSPQELAASMSPALLDNLNEYAARHGYMTVEPAVAA